MKKEKLTSKWSTKKPLYLKTTDKRYKKYNKQLKKYGFCDSETWNLDAVIAEFILPRLKRFREVTNGYSKDFSNYDEWYEVLDKMIFSFEWILTYAYSVGDLSNEEYKNSLKKYDEGMKLFAKYFRNLWC